MSTESQNLPEAWKPLVTTVTPEQLDLVRRTVANGATADELRLYLYDCQRQGVHPLDKLLHFTKRNGKYTPVTSIDLMRIRAAETNEYAGSDDAEFPRMGGTDSAGREYPPEARVTVWRLVQGQRCAFTATARWSEYKPEPGVSGRGDMMWWKMPFTMLAKCAEALALRKGFPRQLAGLYAREEMDQAGTEDRLAAMTPEPPTTVIDTTTGAEVPAAARPEAPEGFRYIDAYSCDHWGWHRVVFNRADAQGGAWTFKTKLERVGAIARQAYQDGVPVRCEGKPGKPKGEWVLDGIVTWKPTKDTLLERATPDAGTLGETVL